MRVKFDRKPRLMAAVPLRRRIWLPCLGLTLLSAAPPCIWDSDTLATELRGIPDAYDLIIGRWHRHGRAYYEERIPRLTKRLEKEPRDLAAYDDLAVAYERLHDSEKAIATMARKRRVLDEEKDRDQLYRYHANLGTFHAHHVLRTGKGSLETALREIEAAIRINKDAHFGRERFQADLIRYAIAARKDPGLWSTHDFLTYAGYQIDRRGWVPHIFQSSYTERPKWRRVPKDWTKEQKRKARIVSWKDAYTGVAGMLRFGGIEGGELYRALGDLFAARRDLHLAWMSYGRAIEKGHPAKAQLEKAMRSIEKHWREAKKATGARMKIPSAEDYRKRRENADRWLATYQRLEASALRKGLAVRNKAVLAEVLRETDRRVPRLPGTKAARATRKSLRESEAQQKQQGGERKGPPTGDGHR